MAPLPRFERLPAGTRAAILAVARAHFAREGFEAASYNRIIAEAGISKTSAYHYFDGKADLYAAVLADVAERLGAVLDGWAPARDPDELWGRLRSTSRALLAHLGSHPEDRALLAAAPRSPTPAASPWVRALVADAVRLRILPTEEQELMTAATEAVLAAVDGYALARPERAEELADRVPELLARLWGAEPPR